MGGVIDVRNEVESILRAGIAAADPRTLVERALGGLSGESGANGLWRGVLAVGKGAPGMYAGVLACCGEGAGHAERWERLMVVPEGVAAPAWALVADHPVPGERGVAAGRAVEAFIARHAGVRGGPGVLVLVSGGTSALLTLPAGNLRLEDVGEVTRALLASGAAIGEINCVRKHIDQLKGGWLAARLAPTRVEGLILSDVVGDDPAWIGSGPLSADPTTYAQARAIVERDAPWCRGVLEHLSRGERGEIAETPKPGDVRLASSHARIIGGNITAVEGAQREAERRGYRVVHREPGVTGDASAAGRRLAQLAMELQQRVQAPSCILMGGETTVRLEDASGGPAVRGGRNQELALSAGVALAGVRGITIGAIGTDGVDGPTDAAGAIADGTLVMRAQQMGKDAAAFLRRHDSYTLFAALEGLIRTGPTGTNVCDLAAALIFPLPGRAAAVD